MKTHDFQKDSSWFAAPHHESPHPLLLDSLRLLLLLTLRVGVPGGDGSGELLHLTGHRAVILFEVLGMLKDAVEIFLKNKSQVFVSVPVTADTTLTPHEFSFLSACHRLSHRGPAGCCRTVDSVLIAFVAFVLTAGNETVAFCFFNQKLS